MISSACRVFVLHYQKCLVSSNWVMMSSYGVARAALRSRCGSTIVTSHAPHARASSSSSTGEGLCPKPWNVSRQKQHVFLGTLAANARIVATSHIASCSIVTPVDSRTARSSSSVMACASARATSKTNKLTFRGCRHIRIGSDSNPRLVCCQIRFERFYVVEYIVKVLYAFRVFISTK